jgi:hypothetical protein
LQLFKGHSLVWKLTCRPHIVYTYLFYLTWHYYIHQ